MIHGLLMALLLLTAPQAGTFKVSGTVVREDKLDPATAPQANQIRISGPSTAIVNIGPGGAFEFPNLRPGSYQIVVGPRITMPPLSVVVTDQDVTGVRVVVPLTIDVKGTVTVDGNGLRPRMQISFTRVDVEGSKPVNLTALASFATLMPAGEYRLSVAGLPAGYSLKSATIGTVDALNQPFRVAQGEPPEISIVLGVSSPPPWVRVRGRVVGGTATNVTLTGTPMETQNVPVGPDGTFEFPMVLAGNYTARTVPAVAIVPPTPITVGTSDLQNVELRIPATKEVSGKITIRGNVPPPRLIFSLANPSAGPSAANAPPTLSIVQGVVLQTAAGTVSIPTNTGPDGLFKVQLPEGERTISILPSSIPAGFSVDSFMYGSTDLLKGPIRVALSDTAEIAITVDATTVQPRNISGKVTGLLNTAGVRVVLQGGNLGTGFESPVAPDGSFGFTGILPGNYSARLSVSGHVISTTVSVGNSDVTNLTINYPRLFSVAAQVLVEGDAADPPAIPPISLQATGPSGVVTASASPVKPTPLILTVSDGEHRIAVRNIPAGYALKSVRYGTVDLQEAPLKVDGPITWEIVVRLVKEE